MINLTLFLLSISFVNFILFYKLATLDFINEDKITIILNIITYAFFITGVGVIIATSLKLV